MLIDEITAHVSSLPVRDLPTRINVATGKPWTGAERDVVVYVRDVLLSDGLARYALDRSVIDLILDLIRDMTQIHAALPQILLPHDAFWIEYRAENGDRCALLVYNDPGLRARSGLAYFVHEASTGPRIYTLRYDLDAPGERCVWTISSGISPAKISHLELSVRQLLVAFCAIVATPRLVEREPVNLDRLNRARARRRKPALLPYSILRLTRTAAAAHRETRPPSGEAGPQRSFHHVRAFTRIRLGKVEFVRPHSRGSRDVGTKTHVRVTAGRPVNLPA